MPTGNIGFLADGTRVATDYIDDPNLKKLIAPAPPGAPAPLQTQEEQDARRAEQERAAAATAAAQEKRVKIEQLKANNPQFLKGGFVPSQATELDRQLYEKWVDNQIANEEALQAQKTAQAAPGAGKPQAKTKAEREAEQAANVAAGRGQPPGAAPGTGGAGTSTSAASTPAAAAAGIRPVGGPSMAGSREALLKMKEQEDAAREIGDITAQKSEAEARLLGEHQQLGEDVSAQTAAIRKASFDKDTEQRAGLDKLRQEMATVEQIDPNAHWSKKDTGGKILAAIGIAMSGIGSSIAGRGASGADSALKIINDAVDQDIAVQQKNLAERKQGRQAKYEAAKGSYEMYKKATDDNDAAAIAAIKEDAFRRAQNETLALAATYQSPLAKAQAKQTAAALGQKAGEFKQQVEFERNRAAQQAATDAAKLDLQRQELASREEIERTKAQLKSEADRDKFTKLSPTIQNSIFQADTHTKAALRNAQKLKDILSAHGTQEFTGKAQEEMNALIIDLAGDKAKITDPGGVVRESDVELVKQQLFQPGTWKMRNETAEQLVDRYIEDISARQGEMYESAGLQRPPTLQERRAAVGITTRTK